MTVACLRKALMVFVYALLSANLLAQLQPGDVSPAAKVLDADKLHPFSDGVARVEKGNASAVINSLGEFVVPYNKWQILSDSKSKLLVVANIYKQGTPTKYGVINSRGEIIIPVKHDFSSFSIDQDGYVHYHEGNNNVYVNAEGNKIVSPIQHLLITQVSFSEGLCPFTTNSPSTMGYVDRKGKIVVAPQFHEAFSFSEGLALVGKKNEFGEMKYGFINKKGEIVIPLQYSKRPSSFSNGLALVEPVQKDDFSYAYINRSGNVAIKINKAPDGSKLYPGDKTFTSGYSEWNSNSLRAPDRYLLDTLGNYITLKSFLQSANVDIKDIHLWTGIANSENGYIVLPGKRLGNGMGFLNVATKAGLPLIFNTNLHLKCDPVSKLFLVSGTSRSAENKNLNGYINEEGVYVIVQKPKEKW